MRKRPFQNRRWVAWLLSMAFALMTLPSGASWQCLDGHACPPGCTMQHIGENAKAKGPASPRACCLPQNSKNTGAVRCALCSSAGSKYSQTKERCTSPVCVLRAKNKPDISAITHVHFVFDVDTNAILLPLPSPILVPEETVFLSFGSPRAPPDRVIVRLYSPRAPPVWLV
jgi:hypothetical protein